LLRNLSAYADPIYALLIAVSDPMTHRSHLEAIGQIAKPI
jgi:hypothetical protein